LRTEGGYADATGADEAEAIRVVEALDGRVERDEKREGKPVVKVVLGARNPAPSYLKALAAFTELEVLYLACLQTTDQPLRACEDCADSRRSEPSNSAKRGSPTLAWDSSRSFRNSNSLD
jgi:hypothetical protein